MRRQPEASVPESPKQKVNEESNMDFLKRCVVSYFASCQKIANERGSSSPGAEASFRGIQKCFYEGVRVNPLKRGMWETPGARGLLAFIILHKAEQLDLKVLVRRYFEQFGETVEGL